MLPNMITFTMKQNWTLNYFNENVRDEIFNLPTGLKARYFFLTDLMLIRGPNLGEPHTKSIGGSLFEIRIKSKEGIARIFYCTMINNQIWMLHSFIKKDQKIPKKELTTAQKRLKELKNER
jgi:phage-related protein